MNLDSTLLSLYHSMPFGASFLAGILTFLSPCLLPLIPPYVSYISGVSIYELEHNGTKHRGKIVLTSFLFVIGFAFVFITLGIFAGSMLGSLLASAWLRYIAGGVIILFGIHFLFPFKFSFLYRYWNLNNLLSNLKFREGAHTSLSLLSPFVLGVGFSIGWSPCVGPILASILTLSASQANIAFYLMLSYCAGLGLCFMLVGIFIDTSLYFLKKLTAFLRFVEVISGVLLMLIGVLIIMQKTDFLLL
ncbi:cytochrome c biogenesis CcdA family protein [Helicobacter marmotae]|uniref:Cytochrome C biogenesis protein n=1 Tax=Helicobacter marmotae TaxID=152490 RepID=A0A3D8I442_9HELI|nr:cytochrome c biogenesis protein CcdA [Helicobacter marmotae]RDU59908.1 cytochrome C biogenesis protein [Helicobacter marmotae]